MIFIEYHIAMNDFFYRYSKCRRKTIDFIFKVLKPKVKNAFISVIEWPRILAWYLKMQEIVINSVNYSVIEWPSIMSRNP